jgi:hypothetical protein
MVETSSQNIYAWIIISAAFIAWAVFVYVWLGPWLRNNQGMSESSSRLIEALLTAAVGYMLVTYA